MKKFRFLSLLVALMTATTGAWADDAYYTLDTSNSSNQTSNNAYASSGSVEVGGITWAFEGNGKMNPWRLGGKNLNNVDRAAYTQTAMGAVIGSVDLTVGNASATVNSLKLIVASDEAFSSVLDEVTATFAASSTIKFTPTSGDSWAKGAFYKFVFNVSVSGSSNKFVEFTKVEFYEAAGETPALTVATPVISPNGGTFLTTQEVTFSCTTEGAEIYYTIDGSDPKSETATKFERTLLVTQTTTVRAVAKMNDTFSNETTATFTQIPSYSTFTSMSSLANNDIFAYTGKAFIIAKPTDRYVYVYNPDERDFAMIYDASGSKTAAAEIGKYITPGWTGKVSIYRNLFELVSDDAIVVNDDPVQPVNYPAIALGTAVMNQVFTLKDITSFSVDDKKNITIIANGDDKDISEAQGVYGYNQFGIDIPECVEGKTYQMVGAIGQYNDKPQFWPIEITEQVEETPESFAVTFDDGEVDAANWQADPAEQQEGQTVTLTYKGKKKVKSITIEKAQAVE
jgi:hypothetical protein